MHTFEAHTSDVEIRVDARSSRELFAEAGLALAEIMLGRAELPPATPEYQVIQLEAPDRDALLVDWLNELIYRAERDGRVFTRFTIEHLTERELTAGVQGAAVPDLRSLVKAATFHGLQTRETEHGVTANVILDV